MPYYSDSDYRKGNKMATFGDIPDDVLIELVQKYLTIPSLKAFRVVAFTNQHLKGQVYTWITKVMQKKVVFRVCESKLNNLCTSPISFLHDNEFDIGIDIPIEAYGRHIVQHVVHAHRLRIREVDLMEDSPTFLLDIFPKLNNVEKLRVTGFHYSQTTTMLITICLQNNMYLTTIELTLVQFPPDTTFPRQCLPNVKNLKLTKCQGAGAAALLNAVDFTVEKLTIFDCYNRFFIPPYIRLPNIREISIRTQHRVLSLDVNLSRFGTSLEKIILKGGILLSPGFVLNQFPNVKTLVLHYINGGYAEAILDACAQSVTAIELLKMDIGRVTNQFPNLDSLIMEYCSGDLARLLEKGEEITTLELRQFTLTAPLKKLMANLKNARLNGKPIRIGKGAILKGQPHGAIAIKSLFRR